MNDTSHYKYKRTIEIRILSSIIAKTGIRALEQRLSEMPQNISHLQFGILRHLSEQPHTISELSKRFFLDPSTLVSSVDALEKKGFLKRERDPNDRRRVPLTITDTGREIVTCVPMVTDDDPLVQALDNIEPETVDQMVEVLRQIVNHMPEGPEMLEHIMQRLHLHMKNESE